MEGLTRAVRAMFGHPVALTSWTATDLGYASDSPATGGLRRVRGRTRDGRSWSIFRKVLQHPRHWPRLATMPPHVQAFFQDDFPWRAELAAWQPGFADRLPPGLRLPALYLLDELGDDRLAVWMEDVAVHDRPWDLDAVGRAARVLGGLAARRSDAALIAASDVPPGYRLRRYVDSRVRGWAGPILADDTVWRHPVLATTVDQRLRADLSWLHERIDAMLNHLDTLPQAMAHGDASPQNLLVPAAAPDTFVAIDAAITTPHAVGFDLGQLLVGLVHAGQLPATALPAIHEILVPSYLDGYRTNGANVDADSVLHGYILTLMLRSGFTSLPFEALDRPPSRIGYTTARERAALTRYIVDLTKPIVPH